MKLHFGRPLACALIVAACMPIAAAQLRAQPAKPTPPVVVKPVIEKPKEYAGEAPNVLSVKVAGIKVFKKFYMPLVLEKVRKSISLNSGAEYWIDRRILAPRVARAGRTKYAIVRIKIYGRGYRTVRKAVVVFIENYETEDVSPSEKLYVSNSPELIVETGTLLAGSISRQETARYLLHHKNGVKGPVNFVFKLTNPGDKPAKVLLVEGAPGKGLKEMNVGHDAALDFVLNDQTGIGRIIEIQPNSAYSIHNIRLMPNEIVSGIGDICLLDGDKIDLEIKANRITAAEAINASKTGKKVIRRGHGTFGPPFVDIVDRFVVGGRWKFIGIGDPPLKNLVSGDMDLMGNYGVTHRVKVVVYNPSDKEEKVEVHFSPVSGPARGSIFVDGALVQVGVVKPPKTEKIKAMSLKPGEERQVQIEMIPESGSFYPIRIVFMARKI
ncbi:MAG: hypothetical protein WCX65_03025 [bacterium]